MQKKTYLNHKTKLANDGYVVIKNFYNKKTLLDAKKEIFNLSKFLANDNSNLRFKENEFDFFVKKSLKKGTEFSSKFYDLSKKFLSMHEFIYNKKLLELSKNLLGTKNVGILPRACGYRIDRPLDQNFITQLHQDYIQNLGAPEGLVFYTSLRKVNFKDGPVIVYKKSHKLGLLNVKISKNSYNKSRSYMLDISKKKLKQFKEVKLKLDERDLAVFDFFLLHKSSLNKSKNIRWSMISRFFSFDSKIGRKNFFPGGLQESKSFEQFHPNKISR